MFSLAGRASHADEPKLVVGSDAPPLTIENWWQNRPLPEMEKGRIYVIDFWASWCGPCRQSMPYLLGLRSRYNDPTIQFAGISIDSDPDDAAKYLTAMGGNFSVYFGVDDSDKNWKAWGRASGRKTIPTTYIVGKDGKIAWIGHPLQLEKPLLKEINK